MQVLPKKERRSSRFLKTSKSMTRRPKTEKQRTGREAQFLGDRDNDNDRKEDVSPMQRTVTILEMCQLQRDPRHPKVEIQDGADDQDDDEVDDEFEDVSLLCTQDQQPLLPDLSLQSEGRNMDLNLVKRDTQLQLKPPSEKEVLDVDSYMARREMTALQERWNALTMLPSPLYCIYFLVAGLWLNEAVLQDSNGYDDAKDSSADHWTLQALLNTVLADDSGCIQSSWFPRLHAVPPLPVVFVALGITLHAPFSFLYHWRYAHSLPPGLARTDHWSRRMDQAMIHAASACASYGTSGSWNYFFANVLFNAHCFYRHFKKEVRALERLHPSLVDHSHITLSI